MPYEGPPDGTITSQSDCSATPCEVPGHEHTGCNYHEEEPCPGPFFTVKWDRTVTGFGTEVDETWKNLATFHSICDLFPAESVG